MQGLAKTVEQSQKTLSAILIKLLNPQAIVPTGFSAPSSNIVQMTNDNASSVTKTQSINCETTGDVSIMQETEMTTPSRPLMMSGNQESQAVTPNRPTPNICNGVPRSIYLDTPELSGPNNNDTSTCLSSAEVTNI